MKTRFLFSCLCLFFIPCEGNVIVESCPPGCECFQRNTIVECREAHLKEIPMLKFASSVKRLVLRGNAIETVEPQSLKRYRNLEYFDVSDNEISKLSGEVFLHNPLLREINLGINPFRCDCDLRDFIERLQAYELKLGLIIIEADLTNCAEPLNFLGKPLLGITFQNQSRNKDEAIYINEENNKGIAICPVKENSPPHARHAMLKAIKPQNEIKEVVAVTHSDTDKAEKKSPNIALIIAYVTAAVLVTCITLVSVMKYLLKNNRWHSYWDAVMDSVKRKPLKREPSTLEAKMKKQRRASCGYAESDCSSDEDSSTPRKTKNGYTSVPTNEPFILEDIALDGSG